MSTFDRQATRLDALEGRYDGGLLLIAIALASVGVVMVASSSIAIAEGMDVGPFHFLSRHLIFLGGGLLLAWGLMRTELKTVEQYSHILLLLCFVALLLVWVPGVGKSVNGARRWLNLGISNFQAVEAVKLMLIVWLASYLVRYRDEIGHRWVALLKPLGVAGAIVALLLLQPDFGSAALILAVVGGMVWLGGANIKHLILPALLALPALAFIAIAEPYRVRRLVSFRDPWADPFNDGFQLTQALIAIGRGEGTGVGLGGSVQKLYYLPEAHTDFIFSVMAEEFGFLGSALIIALFAAFTWQALRLGWRCIERRRHFAGFCAFGVGLWISLQALVSIAVNLGLLPTKGLTLPLISSGGSSVLMTCAAFGLLLRVSYELDRAERQVAKLRDAAQAVEASERDGEEDADLLPDALPALAQSSHGPRGSRHRVEPKWGQVA